MSDAVPTAPGTHRLELPVHDVDDLELVTARLWAAGALGVWERPDRLVAWFPSRPALPGGLEADARWSLEPDRDWQEEWKATIRPVRAGRTLIVPTWLQDRHAGEPGDRTIVLDPGRAFGSGHHATTCMCLELLDEVALATRRVADIGCGTGVLVADIGCGTGVLAIAAAQQGAEVVAVDIDPAAVEVTRENATRNGVTVTALEGSVDVRPGPVDVVVANLVTDVIVTLAQALVAACRHELIVSGIATAREQAARGALEDAGACVTEVRDRDGWIAMRAEVRA